jgi:hypothetical protein
MRIETPRASWYGQAALSKQLNNPAASQRKKQIVDVSQSQPHFAGIEDEWRRLDIARKNAKAKVTSTQTEKAYKKLLERQIDFYDGKVDRVEQTGRNSGIVGGVVGFWGGLAASTMVLFTDLASSAPVGGGVGYKAGEQFGQEMSAKNHGAIAENKKRKVDRQKSLERITDLLKQADIIEVDLGDIETKSKTALQADDTFFDREFTSLADGLSSEYTDLKAHAGNVKPEAGKVPGFAKRYWDLNKQPFGESSYKEVLKELETSQNPDEQIVALKRLYHLDDRNQSRTADAYAKFLRSKYPNVAVTALRMMTQHPALREDENEQKYVRAIGRFLYSKEPELIQAGLDAVMATNYKSNSINCALNFDSKEWPIALQRKALEAYHHRLKQGNARTFNSQEAARALLRGMVGNGYHERELKKWVRAYVGALNASDNKGPALALYLPGDPGIGKTRLVSRIQNEFNQVI